MIFWLEGYIGRVTYSNTFKWERCYLSISSFIGSSSLREMVQHSIWEYILLHQVIYLCDVREVCDVRQVCEVHIYVMCEDEYVKWI